MKEIITRFGNGARPLMKSKEGKDTAVLAFRTIEEATATLAAGAHHADDLWPKMQWSWKAFDAFEDVYTKNPVTPTGNKDKGKEEVKVAARGNNWQAQKKVSWDEGKGKWQGSNYDQWYERAKKQWGERTTWSRWKYGPEPGKGKGEPNWTSGRDDHSRSNQPWPAEEEEPQSTATSSGYNKPKPTMSPALAEKGKEKGKGKGAKKEQDGEKETSSRPKTSETKGEMTEPDPPQSLRDAVGIMRDRQRIQWMAIVREEMQKITKDEEERKKLTEDAQERKKPRVEQIGSSSERTEERSKCARKRSPSREVTPTPTSCVSSDEAAKSPTRERSEKNAKKRQGTPKAKRNPHKRRRYKKESVSSSTSGISLHTDERKPIEVKGGGSLICGKKGDGNFEVTVKKYPKQGPKGKAEERRKKKR